MDIKKNENSEKNNSEVEAAKINAEGTIIASKINIKGAIIVAVISLVTGIGGTLLGGLLESNKGQVTLNQTFNGIIDDDVSSDITLEEIKKNYIQLQSNLDELQFRNDYLLGENTKLSIELDKSNQKIEILEEQLKENENGNGGNPTIPILSPEEQLIKDNFKLIQQLKNEPELFMKHLLESEC